MNDYFERLTNKLLERNDQISYYEARTWVELLWEDFESTYARAGRKYLGKHVTERILNYWIDLYGPNLHKITIDNPKYREWFEKKRFYH